MGVSVFSTHVGIRIPLVIILTPNYSNIYDFPITDSINYHNTDLMLFKIYN